MTKSNKNSGFATIATTHTLYCTCGGKQTHSQNINGWMMECENNCGIRPVFALTFSELTRRWNEAVLNWNITAPSKTGHTTYTFK